MVNQVDYDSETRNILVYHDRIDDSFMASLFVELADEILSNHGLTIHKHDGKIVILNFLDDNYKTSIYDVPRNIFEALCIPEIKSIPIGDLMMLYTEYKEGYLREMRLETNNEEIFIN